MSVADYIEILKKIERDTASRGEWCQLSKRMIFALPERLYRQYPLDLQEVAPEQRIVRGTLWTDTFPNLECSSSDSSDSEGSEGDNDDMKNDLEQHADNRSFPSLPHGPLAIVPSGVEHEVLAFIATMRICQTPWIHECPRLLWPKRKDTPFEPRTDRVRIDAFQALKNFTQTPFGNGMSGLRSETRFDLSAKKVGIDGELIKVDSWRLAEGAQYRLDYKTGQYNMDDFDIYDDRDGQLEIYGPKAVDDMDTDDEIMEDQDMEDMVF
ncbi:hypothetical protein P3342_010603 [Pyrenophora teres f. teres]|uniref:Uncharacterized protein n=2 Tax=Pyrenophora teres f. teres TaxID=97479 RepID=E3RZ84_PYRTT|nr:hypothetical protein PTT_14936 [Pyrenophora teres f. teres 0-1]KAE8828930.1 hypothetical protein PTNB85_08118 [Pyrenophora teres f. teres]KAE8830091.1 hypothetical protein HRS9139_06715 [Pyrenophora teres f. teres]KAE8841569.1 hypothetical protein HRS9122_05695 [Pyrenophora teres f. teres]KAE8859671.1 hypothetical protein PTNB29_06902 [Pyrenophora teres f. teres]